MHAVQYNSYGGGAADLKVHLYSLVIFLFSIYSDFGMLSCSYAQLKDFYNTISIKQGS